MSRPRLKLTDETSVEELAERVFRKKFGKLEEDVNKLNIFLVGIVVAFFIGFIALFVGVASLILDSNQFIENTYRELNRTLTTQDAVIQGYQINEIDSGEIEKLKNIVEQQENIINCLKIKGYFSKECFN